MTGRRIAVTTGAIGLAAGIALGATGLAAAAGSAAPAPAKPTAPAAAPPADPGPGHRPRSGGPGPEGRGPGGRGEALIVSASVSSLVVRTPRGEERVGLTAATTYYAADGTPGTSAVLKSGELVHVRLTHPRAASPVAQEIRLVAPRLNGYVTKVDGSTFTLLDAGGFVRTVTTTSATRFLKDGAAAAASAFPAGTFLSASGTANGAELQAAEVSAGHHDRGYRSAGEAGTAGLTPDA